MKEQIEAVQRMQDYINAHLSENITLDDLAKVAMFSTWYARRIFVSLLGVTPSDYIRRLRLSNSALRLRDEKVTVLDIALDLGFGSAYGYTRAFAREFGCNPKQYAMNPQPLTLFNPYDIKCNKTLTGVFMDIYKTCPTLQNDRYILRLPEDGDINDLLKVYSDLKAVPFFNSDNCHGDDFHYTTHERMRGALAFWKDAYKNGWFVRLAIVDKQTNETIGTIEDFRRDENDYFTECGLLRLDLRSDHENSDIIQSILSLIIVPSFELFGVKIVATKAIPAAKERIKALIALGFEKSDQPLIGHDGTKYYEYYVFNKARALG